MEWAIIGAGPAGIATVGKLLDLGVNPNKILWVDPHFRVGDFGLKWRQVSSNTTVELFLKFLHACPSFSYSTCPINFKLNHLPLSGPCFLHEIADPLQWVSDQLKQIVNFKKASVEELIFLNRSWQIKIGLENIFANNIVLATGAVPSLLSLPGKKMLSVEEALDPEILKLVCNKEDTVAVFGSSHTAIVALYNLMDLGVKKVVNFYRSPLKYAVYMDDWILYDNTGLKRYSAEWARQYLETNKLSNLERVCITDDNYSKVLEHCNKAICAIGFERRKLPHICFSSSQNTFNESISYNESTGTIAPGLFGVGIAFPQGKFDPLGNYEYRVGLWKFMDYLTQVMPIWLQNAPPTLPRKIFF